MVDQNFKRYMSLVVIIVLVVLSFLIIKPIITPIAVGLCLAYIFNPLYKKLKDKVKSENLAIFFIILIILAIILIPSIIILPILTKQIFNVYLSISQVDLYDILGKIFPTLLGSQAFSAELLAASSTFKSALSNFVLSFFQKTVLNLPNIAFGAIIMLLTFFFGLKESSNFKEYISVLFPFPKEYESKFFKQSDKITSSIIYGQFIVGIVQGLVSAIGYYFLGIPNTLFVSIVTLIVGIIPFIGPWLVWIPLDAILFMNGQTDIAIALLIYGLFVINWVDAILRPRIVSTEAQLNPAIVAVGLVGGVYAFGIIGFILGPLILAYTIMVIEIYKDIKDQESIVFKEPEKIP